MEYTSKSGIKLDSRITFECGDSARPSLGVSETGTQGFL